MASVSWAHTRRLHKDQKPRKPLIFKGFPGLFCIKVERVLDPAVASGPLITTVNDLVAVVTYYGLSWLLLLQIMHLAG